MSFLSREKLSAEVERTAEIASENPELKREGDQIFRNIFSYSFSDLAKAYRPYQEKADLPANGAAYISHTSELEQQETNTAEMENVLCDDNGKPYYADGHLLPNTTYELNGSMYNTDDRGRIISCESTPKHTPENPRDTYAQRNAGGEDRRPSDQGGHIVSRDLNGDGGPGNLIAMDSGINQSDYKRMENDVKRELDQGKDITLKTELIYSGDSERPDRIVVTVESGMQKSVYAIDNNRDSSLMARVSETGGKLDIETVQSVFDETGGEITSIKEEYDEKGNLTKTTVMITYTDEDGSSHRKPVMIEHMQGGSGQ